MSNELNITENNVVVVDIEKEMKKSYLDYSMSVIVSRALPDVRDGLKPVHRRILYTMHENGLTPDKAYRKSADTVGSVLGRYHPHGDASVYDALVRLAQDFSLRYPLVDGHGNFGSVDGDPPAAYRYTEARMSKISLSMLTDIEKDTIDYGPNYDDSRQEPLVLPSRFPNLLVNGSSGIAVGMATNIPPHNLGEVIDAVCLLIENPEATMEEIMGCIKGPDFPTGGIIMGKTGIRAAYGTGRGKIMLRARTEIEEMKNGRFRIVVTEIPYMVNKARLIENIADHVKNKRIEGISDLRDESDRDGMRVVIELKKEANPQIVLNRLYSYTQLQETVGVIMLALVNGEPKVLTLKEMLQHYIRFQEQVIYRRCQFELRKAQERAHILEGLKIALDFIDEVIKILRSSKSIPEGKDALMRRFGLTEIQAGAIVAMRLGQLTGLERAKIEEELAALEERIAELQAILGDEHRQLEIVREEISQLRQKYADERRTEIQAVSGEMDIEDLIPNEECVITLTRFGYAKRQNPNMYKAQRRGGRGISGMTRREEDIVEELFLCKTHDYIMFFTNRGRVYRLKGYEIPESSRTARGTNIVNLLPLEADEKVTSMIKVEQFTDEDYLVMLTRRGVVKRTELSAYKNVRKNGLIAISLDEDDELSWVKETDGHNQLVIATHGGMAIKMNETDIRPTGRTARGVRALRLDEEDYVIGLARVRENATLLTVTEKGYGRRTKVEDYRLQSRGGKGIRNYKYNEAKGYVADIKMVDDNDDVILITDDGVIIRLRVAEINLQSRYGSGVRLMKVAEGSRVVTIARTESSNEDDDIEVSHIEEQPDELDDVSADEAEELVEAEGEEEQAQETDETRE